ncbi:hypothetical protein Val02_82260 [Virgisporangium aliadipatigenens]|uniref:Uncharacterized protein n=1 Tax=Virgisporangium aliadipatigenens TaxID=741659 RepID=A0A8J4DUI2_9ACTN|nr:hypothetical protein [Virgisporangium aliadipatigenens]GIJ51340.1 hypothetical protein Val02_82260 [Virgisporangium aliadipatigenens]
MMDEATRELLGRYADDPRIVTGDTDRDFVLRVDDSRIFYFMRQSDRRTWEGRYAWDVVNADGGLVASGDSAEHALGAVLGDPQDDAGATLLEEGTEDYALPELGAFRVDHRIRRVADADLYFVGQHDGSWEPVWRLVKGAGYWQLLTMEGELCAHGEDPETVLRIGFGRPYEEIRLIQQIAAIAWITASTRDGGALQALVNEGIVAVEHRGRPVYVLTDAGHAEAERLAA